jgi:cell division protein FtsB
MAPIQHKIKTGAVPPKKPFRITAHSPIVLLALMGIVVLLAHATWGIYQKEVESGKNVAAVQEEFKALQDRRNLLQQQTSSLNTEEGIEEELRQKFQVAKPGESLMVVVNKPLPPSAPEVNNNFFSKIWSNVSGVFNKKQ